MSADDNIPAPEAGQSSDQGVEETPSSSPQVDEATQQRLQNQSRIIANLEKNQKGISDTLVRLSSKLESVLAPAQESSSSEGTELQSSVVSTMKEVETIKAELESERQALRSKAINGDISAELQKHGLNERQANIFAKHIQNEHSEQFKAEKDALSGDLNTVFNDGVESMSVGNFMSNYLQTANGKALLPEVSAGGKVPGSDLNPSDQKLPEISSREFSQRVKDGTYTTADINKKVRIV